MEKIDKEKVNKNGKLKAFMMAKFTRPKVMKLDAYDFLFSIIDHAIQRLEPLSEGFKNEAKTLQN